MSNFKARPSIFLYMDEAEITDDVRALMIDAGYLPVRVASMDTVRVMPHPVSVDPADVPSITIAALRTILKSIQSTNAHAALFGAEVANLMLGQKDVQ